MTEEEEEEEMVVIGEEEEMVVVEEGEMVGIIEREEIIEILIHLLPPTTNLLQRRVEKEDKEVEVGEITITMVMKGDLQTTIMGEMEEMEEEMVVVIDPIIGGLIFLSSCFI